jgi:hypothetical protein
MKMLQFIVFTFMFGLIASYAFKEDGGYRPYGPMGTNAGPELHMV